jgi:Flp pilus assembly protein CpaB
MAGGKKRRSGLVLILVALIIILGLAAVLLLLPQLLGSLSPKPGTVSEVATTTPTQIQDMEQIIVLAQPVKRGIEIKESMVTSVFYPKAQMVEGLFIRDIKDVLRKRAKYDLEAGIPLTYNLLVSVDNGSFAAFQIPAGYVAISIPISSLTSVAYALQAGDHVNVIGSIMLVDLDQEFQTKLPNYSQFVVRPRKTTETVVGPDGQPREQEVWSQTPFVFSGQFGADIPPFAGRFETDPNIQDPTNDLTIWTYIIPSEKAQRPRLVSQTLIQDAIVLFVGEYPSPEREQALAEGSLGPTPTPTATPTPIPGAPEQPASEFSAITRPTVITIIVTPQDAVTINYLMLAGAKLNLALRSAGDGDTPSTEAVTLQFIMEQYNIPLPSNLPYGLEPRVDGFVEPTVPTAVP